jgi:hypothetical protein
MNRDALLEKIAPCGLVCHTCVAAKAGIVRQHGQALLTFLESFDQYAERLSAYEPRLKSYPDFLAVLQLIGEASCEGCRDGVCRFPGCEIAPCAREKGVDFCYECDSFPCDKADFEPLLKVKWLTANGRMKEIGAKAYFEEVKDSTHYA